jgi:hypothetical protein
MIPRSFAQIHKRVNQETLLTALHEAGHATVAHGLAADDISPTLYPRTERSRIARLGGRRVVQHGCGYTGYSMDHALGNDSERACWHGLIALAGPVAGHLAIHKYRLRPLDPGNRGDYREARRLLGPEYLTRAGEIGQVLVRPAVWSYVEKLATALLAHGRLSGLEVRRHLEGLVLVEEDEALT